MLFTMTLVGLILLIVLVASYVLPIKKEPTVKMIPNPNYQRGYAADPEKNPTQIEQPVPASHPVLVTLTRKPIRMAISLLGGFLVLSYGWFFDAEQGYNYYLQGKFGGETVKTEAIGISWRGFARVRSMKDYLTVTSEPGIESTGSFEATRIRFADKVTGAQQITMRVKTPDDEKKFIGLMKEFRTEENLINALLVPSSREIVSNTPYMFTGQAYASGDAPDYKFAVRDQIMNGGYVMEDDEDRINRSRLEQDSIFSVGQEDGGPILLKKPKEDSNGQPVRISSPILEAGLTVTQVTLPDVDFDQGFDDKLEEQRKQSALIQEYTIKEKAKVAETALEQATGELEKVKTRMVKEKEAVSEIVAVQTALARDSIALLQSKVLRDKAKVEAETKVITADAEAYEISKKVRAGITPEVELQMRLDAEVKIEAEKAKTKWPYIYMPGSGVDGGSLESLIKAGMATQLPNPGK